MTRIHDITLIVGGKRITRQIISDTSINGGRIALNTITDDLDGPFTLICKPAKAVKHPHFNEALEVARRVIRDVLTAIPATAANYPAAKIHQLKIQAGIENINDYQHQVAVLNKAALDLAMEIDWLKNDADISAERKEKATAIIERIYAASTALGEPLPTHARPHIAMPGCLCVECCYAEVNQ